MLKANRHHQQQQQQHPSPSVASIRKAIQQGLDRPDSALTTATLNSGATAIAASTPNLFEQANVNFTDKKWVWVPHETEGYIAGYLVSEEEEQAGEMVAVHLMTGRDVSVNINHTEKVNPPKFEKVEDMADLGYLNEASVVHNLKQRYASNMIYTYSGLFLVAVNPYYNLQIYGDEYVSAYKNKKRAEIPPHIFAIADAAFHDMLHSKENQSVLITGESGAGKTENTKKVIQYLAAITGDHKPVSGPEVTGRNLEKQVLSANPILESFGNAQTIRNNNSSRFAKFIRIEFNFAGQIAGANIEWYLLEKPRVTNQSSQERNYHVFYQFMKGASKAIKDKLLIDKGPEGYRFTKNCRQTIQGVDDYEEFRMLESSMNTMGFKDEEQVDLLRVIAAVLHLGNMQFQATRNDEAVLREQVAAEKVCHVLGIQLSDFTKALLRPSIKAGRDWVTQSQTLKQVMYSVEALARSMYERMFGSLVSRINSAMGRSTGKTSFIGVLDIAGFEILETNSFEQLCINYTNERLQQFFNRTMFVLEQEEYKREGIEWNFIDFGMDLQPTIDLIDRTKPIGILSCLDEECVMPRATDKTFTEKLHGLWSGKSDKYETPRFAMGFTINHYASQVEYSTEGWLEKNKDPLNENVTRLLGNSSEPFIAQLYADYADSSSSESSSSISKNSSRGGGGRVATTLKRGAFRTVGQRHKDQLNMLMAQLNSTQPHFVRCILPNSEKMAGKIDTPLVLDQLRCNGVLEGIRITRQGFPSRVPFPEFRQRYEILAPNTIPRQVFVDSKQAASLLLEALQMDQAKYRLGHTKVFFRAGVLAELEEIRDMKLSKIIVRFQAVARGALSRSRFRRRIEQARAIRAIQRNARVYNELCEWPWWKLYRTVKPLLRVTRVDEEMRKREAQITGLEERARKEEEERKRIEVERSDLERAKDEIENLLLSERNASLDQEEILKRTQEREMALEESLREHAQRLEELEDQMVGLAKEKEDLERQLSSASQRMESEVDAMRDLEVQHKQRDEDLAAAAAEVGEYRQALEKVEQSHSEALERSGELEATLSRARESESKAAEELAIVQKQLEEMIASHERLKQEESGLGTKLAAAEQALENAQAEKQKHVEAAERSISEVAELRKLIDEKADQGTRESELRRMREEELIQLRSELADTLSELEDFKNAHIEGEQALRTEIDELKRERDNFAQEHEEMEANGRVAESQLLEHASRMEELEQENLALEARLTEASEATRSVESEYATARETHDTTSTELESLREELANAQKKTTGLEARLEENESIKDDFQQRITMQSQEYEELKERYDQEAVTRARELESAKTDALGELATVQAGRLKLESKCASLETKQKKLESEIQTLRLEYERESVHAQELEQANAEYKESYDVQAAELQKAQDSIVELSKVQEVGARAETQHREIQEKLHKELADKETKAEEARQQLLKELAALGERLETETSERERTERENAETKSELDRARQAAESSTKVREAVEAARRELGTKLRDAEVDSESLRAAVADYRALADRHEKRAAGLQDTVQARDLEMTQVSRKLQRSERRLEEVMAQAAQHLDARNRLDSENVELREQLDEAYRRMGTSSAYSGRSRALASSGQQGADGVDALEESRQALTQALHAAQREAEEKQNELVDLDRSFGALQDELASAQAALQSSRIERDEARETVTSLRNELTSERARRGTDEAKSGELNRRIEALEEELADREASLREAGDDRDHAEKIGATSRAEARDALDALRDAEQSRDAAERARAELERQTLQLQSKLDDSALRIDELEHVRSGLEAELSEATDRNLDGTDNHGEAINELRGTYHRQLADATKELDAIKRNHVELREAYIGLDSSLALKSQELDRATEDASEARKELSRVMSKLEELVPAYERARDAAKSLEDKLEAVSHDRDSAAAKAIESNALMDEMRRAKDKLERRLDETQNKYIEASKGRQTAEKAALQLEDELLSVKAKLSEIDDDQITAEDRASRLDAVVADAHLALDREREANTVLTKEKNSLQRQVNDLRLRVASLETDAVASLANGAARSRASAIPAADLTARVEAQARATLESQQRAKQMERQIRELQYQIGEKDKAKLRADSDLKRMASRVKRLEEHISQLESAEQKLSASKHRLERELATVRSRHGSPTAFIT